MNPDAGYTPPPPRAGKPWWIWVLGGCGGCLLIMVVALFVAGIGIKNLWNKLGADIGPVTEQSVKASFGSVPLYPGSKLEPQATKIMLDQFRMAEKVAQRPPGSLFKGAAAFVTQDSADKVSAFYEKALTKAGWKEVQNQSRGPNTENQRTYRKQNEMLIVQPQPTQGQGDRTTIVLMLGGPEMAQHMPGGAEKPGATP